jgi:putative transposase
MLATSSPTPAIASQDHSYEYRAKRIYRSLDLMTHLDVFKEGVMGDELSTRRAELIALTKRSTDPKVRHRAHSLIDLLDSPSIQQAAERTRISARPLRRWRTRFLAEGGVGLCDRLRAGRPPKRSSAPRARLQQALEEDPMAYGYPVPTWTMADLTDLLARRGWVVSAAAVYRTVHGLGYVHRRPRHDLRHRQDAEAVASAQHGLATLPKKGLISAAESGCSISMNANFTPIPTWRSSGGGAGNPAASASAGDAAHFETFLGQVIDRWPDDVLVLVLVLDNAAYHKTAAPRGWFAEHADRIGVLWLPTDRPQLNPIERVWRFVKSKLACHAHGNDLDGLQAAAQVVLDRTRATFAASTYPPITLGQDFCKSA